jgi:S1-C subfamily serine protease
MSSKTWYLLVVGMTLQLGQIATGQEARAQQAAPAPLVVYCYDHERDVVSRELASSCHGIVVDEAEVAAIKARRDQEIARSMAKSTQKGPEGRRLVSVGTAFYVDEIGRLLTNHHVIADCEAVLIGSGDHPKEDAKVVAVDAQHDLALLQATDRAPAFAWFRSGGEIGLTGSVVAVGFPDEGLPTVIPVATPGKLLRADDGLGHIVIGADMRHGNSGSPIFDTGGLVIGIVDAKLNIARVFAQTGRQVDDTGIGIAVATIVDFLRRTNTPFHLRDRNADADNQHIFALAQSFVTRAECWR